jgi:hypothetical protein
MPDATTESDLVPILESALFEAQRDGREDLPMAERLTEF